MNGVILGATFSWGCLKALDLGISEELKEYAESRGKSRAEKEIKKDLKKLASYLFYRVIALANGIGDPFELEIIEAHWIGNKLLDRVKPEHAVKIIREELAQEEDPLPLAYILKSVLEGRGAHHNAYVGCAGYNKDCAIKLKNGYFWHLGSKRLLATLGDMANFEKYGAK